MNSDKVYIAYTIIFIIVFSKFYKIYDFPQKIISKMNIKNEILILALIIFIPIILYILVNFVLEQTLKIQNFNNDIFTALIMGWMWSMVINYKKYKNM